MFLAGSSTACLVTVDPYNGVVHGANLGDSGLFVINKSDVVYQTTEQQYSFNAPYQLAILPEGFESSFNTTPAMADTFLHNLKDGDVIVLATDGLLDNVFPREIPRIIASQDSSDPSGMARALVQHAHTLSESSTHMSPFAVRSKRYRGGKPDDITVVVLVFRCQQL